MPYNIPPMMHHEVLIERSRLNMKRSEELALILKEFITDIEAVGAQQVYDEGWVDLLLTYEKACGTLGLTPQTYEEETFDSEESFDPNEGSGYLNDTYR